MGYCVYPFINTYFTVMKLQLGDCANLVENLAQMHLPEDSLAEDQKKRWCKGKWEGRRANDVTDNSWVGSVG